MYCTVAQSAIATTTDSCNQLVVHTPQRKARYSDKARVRLAAIKRSALRECKCRDTKEMKQRLSQLGIKLDLRLTSAWIAIAWELQPVIEKLAAASCQTVVIEQPSLPAKKILSPITDRHPPVFLSEEEAMNYYLNKYSPC